MKLSPIRSYVLKQWEFSGWAAPIVKLQTQAGGTHIRALVRAGMLEAGPYADEYRITPAGRAALKAARDGA